MPGSSRTRRLMRRSGCVTRCSISAPSSRRCGRSRRPTRCWLRPGAGGFAPAEWVRRRYRRTCEPRAAGPAPRQDSGTRCSRFALVRSAGAVHTAPPNSISFRLRAGHSPSGPRSAPGTRTPAWSRARPGTAASVPAATWACGNACMRFCPPLTFGNAAPMASQAGLSPR